MEWEEDKIVLDKELNKLDELALDFARILKEFTDCVFVSGYVAILFGRSRVSEDIDLLIPALDRDEFEELHSGLDEEFWCLNGEDLEELYSLLEDGHSIRYARKEDVVPNIEVKFMKSRIDEITWRNKIPVNVGNVTIHVSPLELQIAFKEVKLGTRKDKEDALHLREVFKEKLSEERVKYYKDMIKDHG